VKVVSFFHEANTLYCEMNIEEQGV